MGQFAKVFDLPGNEQLLTMVVNPGEGQEPYLQVATDIFGSQVTMDFPLDFSGLKAKKEKEGGDVTVKEVMESAYGSVDSLDYRAVLELRKVMVSTYRENLEKAEQQATQEGK